MLSYFVNFGVNKSVPDTSSNQWRIPFALQMLPGALLLAGIIFQNESPRWLVEKNKIEKARSALAQVRALPISHPAIATELDEIIEYEASDGSESIAGDDPDRDPTYVERQEPPTFDPADEPLLTDEEMLEILEMEVGDLEDNDEWVDMCKSICPGIYGSFNAFLS